MSGIHNIFSDKKEKEKPSARIIVDKKEKNSLVFSYLISKKAEAIFENLEIGDYLIQDIVIERKTFSDFILSIIDKRLFVQLKNMSKYNDRFLILEGFDYNYSKFSIHEKAIKGAILCVIRDFKTPIIYTQDEKDTASFLVSLSEKMKDIDNSFSIRPKRDFKTLEEQKQFILEGFKGVGPRTALELLKKFGNLKKIFNLKKEDLHSFNMSEKIIQNFFNVLEN